MKILAPILVFTLIASAHPSLLKAQTLELDYSTYLGGYDGGVGNDHGLGITIDSEGYAYITGLTRNNNFPTENPYQASRAGGSGDYDAFVSKISSTGSSLVYSTYLGGSSTDQGYNIAIDEANSPYVIGSTASTNFPTENPYQSSKSGLMPVFVTKLISSGTSLIYSTYLGGNDQEFGYGITVDSAYFAYVVGRTLSPDFPTVNPYQASYGGGSLTGDVFIVKFSTSGSSLVFATYLGGSADEEGRGITLDTGGCAYVTGHTGSTDFPTIDPYQGSYAGSPDAFVSKLSSDGSFLVYSTYIGGNSVDKAKDISLDIDNAAYLTGFTISLDFPVINAYQSSRVGSTDAFVSKLSSSGSSLAYSTYLGSSSEGHGIAVGPEKNAYIAGQTSSSSFPVVNPYQSSQAGGYEAIITKFSSSGSSLIYSTYLGGGDDDYGYDIALGSDEAAYVTGSTKSSNFPTENSYQSSFAGGFDDGFVTKLNFQLTPTLSPTPSVTLTPSVTPTPTVTPTASVTPTPSATPTPSVIPTPLVTPTPSMTPVPTTTPISGTAPWIYDYNGDGTSDIAIFRPTSGLWAIRGITRVYFGNYADEPIPGDYNGDRTTDIGVFRSSSGLWAIRSITRAYFGSINDLPEPGDYDGDGTADIGIFRFFSGLWAIRGVTRAYFGGATDIPASGYYNGDGTKEIGIFRASSGLWAVRGISRVYYGSAKDIIVPGDYDGDGTWDYGIFRDSSGLWAVREITRCYFGSSIDEPIPAVYRGNSQDNIGIFRESSGLWAIRGITRIYFGSTGDIPVTR